MIKDVILNLERNKSRDSVRDYAIKLDRIVCCWDGSRAAARFARVQDQFS